VHGAPFCIQSSAVSFEVKSKTCEILYDQVSLKFSCPADRISRNHTPLISVSGSVLSTRSVQHKLHCVPVQLNPSSVSSAKQSHIQFWRFSTFLYHNCDRNGAKLSFDYTCKIKASKIATSHSGVLFAGSTITATRKLSDLQRQADLLGTRDHYCPYIPFSRLGASRSLKSVWLCHLLFYTNFRRLLAY